MSNYKDLEKNIDVLIVENHLLNSNFELEIRKNTKEKYIVISEKTGFNRTYTLCIVKCEENDQTYIFDSFYSIFDDFIVRERKDILSINNFKKRRYNIYNNLKLDDIIDILKNTLFNDWKNKLWK